MKKGVIYRKPNRFGWINKSDYEEAINNLVEASKQLRPDGNCCIICGDCHQAWECHHNPLVMARKQVKQQNQFRCFHCGGVFSSKNARIHFGTLEEARN